MGKERDTDGKIKDTKNRASWTTGQIDLLVSLMKEYEDAAKFRGKTAEGKGCKRTTDLVEEKFSLATELPGGERFTQQVLNAAGLNSPSPTLPAPGFEDQHYEWSKGIYEDMNTLPDPPPMKKARTSKGNDEGKTKRGKETAIEALVAVRKEELKTYVDVKTKQVESYREVKMTQMEQKDPDKDPYCIANCNGKLKTIPDLSASEHLKMIEHLKAQRADREIFMTVGHDLVLEILKNVLGHQI
ncbi:hypothetical protein D1007_45163 [Hordeum vulgare]|nr:hypothetical protein D1007_45163 [Hordeum vulgare]